MLRLLQQRWVPQWGTIAACAPIAFGFSQVTEIETVYAIGAVVGGAMFGDNLSMISDTTIAATSSQKVQLRDKFKVNVWIAVPASIVSLIIYLMISQGSRAVEYKTFDVWLILPYVAVFILAFSTLHVLAVLALGVVLSGLIGSIQQPDFNSTGS